MGRNQWVSMVNISPDILPTSINMGVHPPSFSISNPFQYFFMRSSRVSAREDVKRIAELERERDYLIWHVANLEHQTCLMVAQIASLEGQVSLHEDLLRLRKKLEATLQKQCNDVAAQQETHSRATGIVREENDHLLTEILERNFTFRFPP